MAYEKRKGKGGENRLLKISPPGHKAFSPLTQPSPPHLTPNLIRRKKENFLFFAQLSGKPGVVRCHSREKRRGEVGGGI